MEDPVKVVEQYRRYVSDGRLEIAEVMAQELSEMLLARKKPLIPVRIAIQTATVRKTKPTVPLLILTVVPVAQVVPDASNSGHGTTIAVAIMTTMYITAPAIIAPPINLRP